MSHYTLINKLLHQWLRPQEVRREDCDAAIMFWTDVVKWAEEGALGNMLIVAEKHQ